MNLARSASYFLLLSFAYCFIHSSVTKAIYKVRRKTWQVRWITSYGRERERAKGERGKRVVEFSQIRHRNLERREIALPRCVLRWRGGQSNGANRPTISANRLHCNDPGHCYRALPCALFARARKEIARLLLSHRNRSCIKNAKRQNNWPVVNSLRNIFSNKIIYTRPTVAASFIMNYRNRFLSPCRDFRPTEFIGFCRIAQHHVSSNNDRSRDFRSLDSTLLAPLEENRKNKKCLAKKWDRALSCWTL